MTARMLDHVGCAPARRPRLFDCRSSTRCPAWERALCCALIASACVTGCARLEENGAAVEQANHATPEPWFLDVTTSSGLLFVHETGATGDRHMPEIMGSGAAIFDFDNDDDLDIYLINGAFHFAPPPDGTPPPRNQLFRQDDDLQFTNVTDETGLGDGGYGMGVAIGDIDNDGWLDVYVTNYGADQLYRNRGDSTFENVTEAAGINVPGWSCSAAFLDYDRDGYLDLYITQYVQYRQSVKCSDMAGRPDYCGPKSFPPATDVLLRNNGNGTFSDVSTPSGIASVAAAGLGVVCADFDSDGWIDIYVANDAYANNLWLNQRDGTFVDAAKTWGCALNAAGQREAGMGVVAADLDNDLLLDLFVTHLANETNTLYRGEGNGAARAMSDFTARSGLGPSSAALTGFGVVANDLDLDGGLDLVVVNGRVVRAAPLAGAQQAPPWNVYAEPNLVYLGHGNGTFDLLGQEVEALAGPIEISRGLCAGDVDRDGRVDLLVTNTQGPAHLYLNIAPRRGRWMSIRAIDPRYRRDAIGASLLIESSAKSWRRTVIINDSYLSATDASVHVGLGEIEQVDRVHVTWPDGLVESFTPPCIDCAFQLVRGDGEELPP